MMRPLPSIYSSRSMVLSCASPLTPPLTRSPSTRPRRRGVRRSSSHRPGRRPSLATARGRPRGIGRSRGCSSSAGAAGKRRQGTIVRADTHPMAIPVLQSCGRTPAVRTSSLDLRLASRSHSTIIRRAIVELTPLVEIDGLVVLCHLPSPDVSGAYPLLLDGLSVVV